MFAEADHDNFGPLIYLFNASLFFIHNKSISNAFSYLYLKLPTEYTFLAHRYQNTRIFTAM